MSSELKDLSRRINNLIADNELQMKEAKSFVDVSIMDSFNSAYSCVLKMIEDYA